MPADHVIAADLVRVVDDDGKLLRTLAWGDEVEVVGETAEAITIGLTHYTTAKDGSVVPHSGTGTIRKPSGSRRHPGQVVVPRDQLRVLKVDFVDVQQGDASVIETPSGKVVLVDAGENQLFARYLANRYPGTSDAAPKEIDCIVVSHGDADHFAGIAKMRESEDNENERKRFFIHPRRVFHNGLVKRPSTVGTNAMFGPTVDVDGQTIITGLVDDLLAVPEAEMNTQFVAWKKTLEAYARRGPIEIRHLVAGDDDAFQFLGDDGISVEVLAPMLTTLDGVTGLTYLREPPASLKPVDASEADGAADGTDGAIGSKSASHTINGHSVVLRVTFGDWHFLYAGDMNDQAETRLLAAHAAGERHLDAEVFKVPHHGSADFSPAFLEAVAPVVSVVSSGDESTRKEYIHPRATLLSALGRHARGEAPVTFVTELVAFFETENWVQPGPHPEDGARQWRKEMSPFFAFSRAAYGIVRVRTDGRRLLVYTDSGQVGLKEAYAFCAEGGQPRSDALLKV